MIRLDGEGNAIHQGKDGATQEGVAHTEGCIGITGTNGGKSVGENYSDFRNAVENPMGFQGNKTVNVHVLEPPKPNQNAGDEQ